MASRAGSRLAKAKAARQKKLLLLLVPILVILAVIQGPKLMKTLKGATATPEPAPQSQAPTDVPTIPPAPATGTALLVDGALPDSDPQPAAEEGQLVSFGRFVAGDPFRQLVVVPRQKPEEGGAAPAPSSEPGEPPSPETPAAPGEEPVEPQPTSVEIVVNGTKETVAIDGTFPEGDPAFKLVAVEGKTAKIGLVTGSFSSGVETIDLDVGESIILVSQPDGFRYRLELLSIQELVQ